MRIGEMFRRLDYALDIGLRLINPEKTDRKRLEYIANTRWETLGKTGVTTTVINNVRGLSGGFFLLPIFVTNPEQTADNFVGLITSGISVDELKQRFALLHITPKETIDATSPLEFPYTYEGEFSYGGINWKLQLYTQYDFENLKDNLLNSY